MCLGNIDKKLARARNGIAYKVFNQKYKNAYSNELVLCGWSVDEFKYPQNRWISFCKGGPIGRLVNRFIESLNGGNPGFYLFFNKEDALRMASDYVVHKVEYKGLFQTGTYDNYCPAGRASKIKVLERVHKDEQKNHLSVIVDVDADPVCV